MTRLEQIFGDSVWNLLADKIVIDFGCGEGGEALEAAQHGARRVIGVDIRESILDVARKRCRGAENLEFTSTPAVKADVILSLDAFEHFGDPEGVLVAMAGMLKQDGVVLVSFGPTWYHPRGGHLFSFLPWVHLMLPERLQCWGRSFFRDDGAKRFNEVEGGLNQMTIRRFEQIVAASPFYFDYFECVPIRVARRFHSRVTREFLSSVVRCRLKPRN